MLPGQLYLSLSRVPAWRGGLEKIKEVLFPLQFTVLNPVLGFPGGSDGKESAWNVGDLGSILGSGRSPRERNGYPLQYSCLQNSTDRGTWQATVHGVAKSDTTERLTLSLLLYVFQVPVLCWICDLQIVTLEQHRFELCRSTYMWIFSFLFTFLSRPTLKEWPLFLYFLKVFFFF